MVPNVGKGLTQGQVELGGRNGRVWNRREDKKRGNFTIKTPQIRKLGEIGGRGVEGMGGCEMEGGEKEWKKI